MDDFWTLRTRPSYAISSLSQPGAVTQKLLTNLDELVSELGDIGVDGPRHFRAPNLDGRGRLIGSGAQFDVFEDRHETLQNVVMKRVKELPPVGPNVNQEFRSRLRTLQLEIASLCDSRRRENRNTVDLVAWGYDYPSSNLSQRLPVLLMEKALTSLSNAIAGGDERWQDLTIRHHLCLGVAAGLKGIHDSGLAHGDIKPDNVLVFHQNHPSVPFVAKLSDFGQCIDLEHLNEDSGFYLGTEGWLPPEVQSNGHHCRLSRTQLLKVESYAFGLLVMSVFLHSGKTVPYQQYSAPCNLLGSPCAKAESSCLPESIAKVVDAASRGFLNFDPTHRLDVKPEILDCNTENFQIWLSSRTKTPLSSSRPGEKAPNLFAGYAYYFRLDPSSLVQLEAQFDDPSFKDENFSKEVLFGMAIRTSKLERPRDQDRTLMYMKAAAERSHIPAQAMIARINQAVQTSSVLSVPHSLVDRYLYNGAVTGSYIALEDLRARNVSKAHHARQEFRLAGGYNNNISRSKLVPYLQPSYSATHINEVLDEAGNQPLHYAAAFGEAKIVRELIRSGATIDQENGAGETPLYQACLAGSSECVEILTVSGANAAICAGPFSVSCLHWLFNFDDEIIPSVALWLISRGAKLHARTKHIKDGKIPRQISWHHFPFHWPPGTPLHWASFTRSSTAVEALLREGANVDELDMEGEFRAQTALSIAMYRGDSKMVELLVSNGANPNRTDGAGCTPAHMMAITSDQMNGLFNMSNALKWWTYHGSWTNHLSELNKCATCIRSAGGDLNAQSRVCGSSDNLATPILDAAQYGSGGSLLALLNAGASPKCRISYSGESPFHIWVLGDSRRQPYHEAFKLVCEELLNGADDPGLRDAKGRSVLHSTLGTSSDEDFQYLTRLLTSSSRPIHVDVTDYEGSTPLLMAAGLHFSTDHSHEAVDRSAWLLGLGANPRARDADNRDLVWIACNNISLSDTQCLDLIERSMRDLDESEQKRVLNTSMSMSDQQTALIGAVWNHFGKVVSRFLKAGVDFNRATRRGMTALDTALDHAQHMRQQRLNIWFSDRRLIFDGRGFIVKGAQESTPLSIEALQKNRELQVLLFQTTYTENDFSSTLRHDVDYGILHKYIACIEIIEQLTGTGALRGRDFLESAVEYSSYGPREWDQSFVEVYGDELAGYSAEMQPFYHKHWDVLYKFRQD